MISFMNFGDDIMILNIILFKSLYKQIAKLSGVAKMPSALFLQKIGSVLSLALEEVRKV